jgi:hypothetical protein
VTVDQQLATVRQLKELRRDLRRHELTLMAIIAIQLINLIVGLSKL